MQKSSNATGEEQAWQALANAIVIQTVKDYRSQTRMIQRIRRRLKRKNEMTESETIFQEQRLWRYEEEHEITRDFFFSQWFSVLSNLEGYDLLNRLEEAMR